MPTKIGELGVTFPDNSVQPKAVTVNSGTGAITIQGTGDAGNDGVNPGAILVSTSDSTITLQYRQPYIEPEQGNSSIHPDTLVEMADGSKKWLHDIRLGDVVRGRHGPAEVLGVWTNILQERSLWEVHTEAGAVVCTPGHLFPCMPDWWDDPNREVPEWNCCLNPDDPLETPRSITKSDPTEVWGAPNPDMYWRNSHGRKRTVKSSQGLLDTCCLLGTVPSEMVTMRVGTQILCADGQWRPVTKLREVTIQGSYDSDRKITCETRVTKNQQVMALYLDTSDIFFADGHAVAGLA